MNHSIVFLSTSLGMGGADQQIINLSRALLEKGYSVQLVSMTPLGKMGLEAQAEGLPVHSLNMKRGIPNPVALLKLIRWLNQWQPQILHSHMFHANLLARLTRLIKPIPIVISTAQNINEGGRWREFAYTLTDFLADLTTQVSQAGVERYKQIGAVPEDKILFSPNSVDLEKFAPNLKTRNKLRQQLDVKDKFVWLAVGRNHPQKDYSNLIKAFAQVHAQHSEVILLIAGDGFIDSPEASLVKELDLTSCIHFLGVRRDIPELMNASDAYVMSSAWEGMPLVLLEASSTALPLVVTDVGGNSEVVLEGKSGFLVPPQNSSKLAEAMIHLMELPQEERQKMAEVGRSYMQVHYSLKQITEMWEKIYQDLLTNKRFEMKKSQQ